MIEMRRVKDGLLEYANRELIPKMEPGKQFMAGVVMGLSAGRLESILTELAGNSWVKMLGIVEGNMVDLEKLYAAMTEQFARQPVLPLSLPMLGTFNLNAEDAKALYKTIVRTP